MTDTTITRIDTWACRVPLPGRLQFRTFVATDRRYCAVRVRTAGGLEGVCIGHTRGAPQDVAITDVLAPVLIGRDAAQPEARLAELHAAVVAMERDGLLGRAISLLEICLWDIAGQAAGRPVWQLLGGVARDLPVSLVEGYAIEGEARDGLVRRMVARAAEGYRMLKIEGSHYDPPEALAEDVRAIRAAAGPGVEIVVDFAWSWTAPGVAEATLAVLPGLGLGWVEDPIPRDPPEAVAALRRRLPCPLAIGDETTRPSDLARLVEAGAIDVMRLDPTTLGGFGPALALGRIGAAAGLRLSPHVNPEIARHLALALPAIDHIEMFPADRPFDATHRLIRGAAAEAVRGGSLPPATAPGLGLALDEAAVAATAYRSGSVGG